jgi:hypothetical protein
MYFHCKSSVPVPSKRLDLQELFSTVHPLSLLMRQCADSIGLGTGLFLDIARDSGRMVDSEWQCPVASLQQPPVEAPTCSTAASVTKHLLVPNENHLKFS